MKEGKRIGFWRDSEELIEIFPESTKVNSSFPFPIADSNKRNKQEIAIWINKLENLEKSSKIVEECYFGYSYCRICGKDNGNTEFRVSDKGNVYIWPSGFRHYGEIHYIHIPDDFWNFINNHQNGLNTAVK